MVQLTTRGYLIGCPSASQLPALDFMADRARRGRG